MKEINLTRGKTAIVSDHQYERVSKHKWSAVYSRGKWYAQCRINGKLVKLHRFLMNVTDSKIEIDHKNSDGLDCRDENMRTCTHAINVRNQAVRHDNAIGLKGVHWMSRNKKYRARIQIDGVRISLGLFANPVDAASAYDEAAKKYFGEYARTNF